MREARQLFFGPFRLDPTNECLWRGEKEIRLHPKAFRLLQHLLDYPGQMVTKGSLLEMIWPGVHVTEAILSVYVAEIRKTLGEDPKKPVFIETLHRRGYRFIAPVTIDLTTEISESTAGSEELLRPIVREAATAIGAEPIIGREKELSFLLEKMDAALHGTGSVVFTTGPAGIGKTRLVRELRHHAARCGFQWFGGKYEKSANHPYAVWVDMLKGYLQQKDATSLHVLIGPYTAELASIVPEVMPRANSTSSFAQEDSEIERTRLLEAWTHLLVQISREAPLVLFLDDVQWAGSLELLHHLARNIGNQRILALVAYRDDELKMNPTLWKTILAHEPGAAFSSASFGTSRTKRGGTVNFAEGRKNHCSPPRGRHLSEDQREPVFCGGSFTTPPGAKTHSRYRGRRGFERIGIVSDAGVCENND